MNIISYRYIMLCVVSLGVLVGCNNKLDLKPDNSVETDLSTLNDVETLMRGAYTELGGQFGIASDGRGEGGELYGADFILMSELLGAGGEISWTGTFSTFREVESKAMTAGNTMIRNNWLRAYTVINICNNVLKGLTDLGETGTVTEGEAKFVRAAIYFELVRFFAKPWEAGGANTQDGVPLITAPTVTLDDAKGSVTRATVAAVYTQVIQDLKDAETLLAGVTEAGKANQYAVNAMLARVYLQQGEYDKARDQANTVIGSEVYNLNSNYKDNFSNEGFSAEDIFGITQNSNFNAGTSNGGLATFFGASAPFGDDRDEILINEPYFALFTDANDARAAFFTDPDDPNTLKWEDATKNIPVIRLAEMLLVRAECNERLGTAIGATPLVDINLLRTRAGAANFTMVDLATILAERRLELAFEGQRIHDIKRLQETVDGFAYNADELVLPIPQREIDVLGINQNDGYGN